MMFFVCQADIGKVTAKFGPMTDSCSSAAEHYLTSHCIVIIMNLEPELLFISKDDVFVRSEQLLTSFLQVNPWFQKLSGLYLVLLNHHHRKSSKFSVQLELAGHYLIHTLRNFNKGPPCFVYYSIQKQRLKSCEFEKIVYNFGIPIEPVEIKRRKTLLSWNWMATTMRRMSLRKMELWILDNENCQVKNTCTT